MSDRYIMRYCLDLWVRVKGSGSAIAFAEGFARVRSGPNQRTSSTSASPAADSCSNGAGEVLGVDPADGVGPGGDAHLPHQYAQRRRGQRRRGAVDDRAIPRHRRRARRPHPLVGECDDSWLNDVAGRHGQAGEHSRGPGDGEAAGRWRKARWAAATGYDLLPISRRASAPPRASSVPRWAATPRASW